MSVAHLYKDLGEHATFAGDFLSVEDDGEEAQKLDAFDKGYQAGWDDCLKAQTASQQHISSDFAKNLQEISFTYHEARGTLMQGLKPLFSEIINKILPELSRATLGQHIVEKLQHITHDLCDRVIEINVSPQDYETLKLTLDREIKTPFVMSSQNDISPGQVYLRIGEKEQEIDLSSVISEIQNSTDNLFEQEHKHE